MPVSALELRPRGPAALVDAALHLCAQDLGIWSLALSGGALVTAAAIHLSEALRLHHPLGVPSLLLAAAWFARGLFQGAACHYVEHLVLDTAPPSAWTSLKAALGRAPSLFIAVAVIALINTLGTVFTFGIGYFVFTAHLAGYATVMRGVGHPLGLYRTSARLLGGAAGGGLFWIRLAFWGQLLLGLNLYLATAMLLFIGSKLMGFDLAFLERYTSFDNPAWLITLVALTFTLTEPLRATVSALLLIDGRVRQEGLDLVAALEQLPRRQRSGRAQAAAKATGAAALLVLALCLPTSAEARASKDWRQRKPAATHVGTETAAKPKAPPQPEPAPQAAPPAPEAADDEAADPAQGALPQEPDAQDEEDDAAPNEEEANPASTHGGPDAPAANAARPSRSMPATPSETVERLGRVLDACGGGRKQRQDALRAAGSLGEKERGALVRLLVDAEALAYDEQDCDDALDVLDGSLGYVSETVAAQTQQAQSGQAARERAKAILARPEFAEVPKEEAAAEQEPPADAKVPDPNSWWERFKRWLRDLLSEQKNRPDLPRSAFAMGSGAGLAQGLIAVLAVLVVGILGYLMFVLRPQRQKAEVTLETLPGGAEAGGPLPDGQNALSRPPEGWASLADQLAARGEFREALRSLYLATLSRLHRDGAIDYDPAQSNWEYFRRFRGPREWVPPFRELTTRFDYAFYGHVEVNPEGYRRFRELSAPILSAPPRPDAEAPRA